MPKAKADLVIVESPAKAKTIEKYLGKNYKVTASMGHLRDLPKSTMGVDLDNHRFEPHYQPVKGREDVIAELKRAAAKSGTVYLATDPDREGEAISWHLKELLELPDDKARRVTFNEITKKVVTESIQNPRDIDIDLVNAQQARRILDRIVGYKLSPLLWRKVRRGLSAGRVQSVATRLVCDREDEIRAFVPEEFWHMDVQLDRTEKPGSFTARFHGTTAKKQELGSVQDVNRVLDAITGGASYTRGCEDIEITNGVFRMNLSKAQLPVPFTVSDVKRGEKKRSPSPPFITSTLQQEASRRLGMTPRRTMSIAQQLYEGVDIQGEGTVGLITYMRTDSLRISEDALGDARDLIVSRYGPDYYYGKPRVFKTGKAAQDAHEAIRPSNVALTPDMIRKDVTNDQYRLYRLIWGRFTASQMSNAIYDNVVISAQCQDYVFRANHSELKFAGYTAVYEEGKDEDTEASKRPLPELTIGESLKLQMVTREQKFTQPPARYTEATLIRAMEEKGIGRPSTYAPTISTITNRDYVIKEGKSLQPTILGEVITGLMKERFSDIVDVKFTARMEENLDDIEEGKREWKSVLDDFYTGFDKELTDAEKALEGEHIKIPAEVTDELCDKCGKNMVIKFGKFGRFLACPGYPECDFTKPLVVEMPGKCPKCGGRILKRTSKKGYTYYACEKGAQCGFMTWDVPVKETCPECSQTMFKKSGRGQKKPFCINELCSNFLPEDKRGYKKKTAADSDKTAGEDSAKEAEAENSDEKKPAKKTAKKPEAKKPAVKKPAAKKPAAKKTAAKKPAVRKSTAKKTADKQSPEQQTEG